MTAKINKHEANWLTAALSHICSVFVCQCEFLGGNISERASECGKISNFSKYSDDKKYIFADQNQYSVHTTSPRWVARTRLERSGIFCWL